MYVKLISRNLNSCPYSSYSTIIYTCSVTTIPKMCGGVISLINKAPITLSFFYSWVRNVSPHICLHSSWQYAYLILDILNQAGGQWVSFSFSQPYLFAAINLSCGVLGLWIAKEIKLNFGRMCQTDMDCLWKKKRKKKRKKERKENPFFFN